MKIIQFLAIITSLLFWSCGTDPRPTVVYPSDSTGQIAEQQLVVDTALVLTGELPLHFDSTDYLLFPIGPIRVYNRGSAKSYFGSGSPDGKSFSIGYLSGTTFTGNIDNVMIQHLDSSTFRPMAIQNIKIRSFQFLESIRKKTGLQIVVMKVIDRDTNNDGKLTDEDIESLYLSHLNGENFKKLTFEFQELLDWKVITINKRLYFRALEDTDKNGEFNRKDKIHHFFVDLEDNDFKVVKYDPLN